MSVECPQVVVSNDVAEVSWVGYSESHDEVRTIPARQREGTRIGEPVHRIGMGTELVPPPGRNGEGENVIEERVRSGFGWVQILFKTFCVKKKKKKKKKRGPRCRVK